MGLRNHKWFEESLCLEIHWLMLVTTIISVPLPSPIIILMVLILSMALLVDFPMAKPLLILLVSFYLIITSTLHMFMWKFGSSTKIFNHYRIVIVATILRECHDITWYELIPFFLPFITSRSKWFFYWSLLTTCTKYKPILFIIRNIYIIIIVPNILMVPEEIFNFTSFLLTICL